MAEVLLLNGLPAGFLARLKEIGFDGIIVEPLSFERLAEILAKADKIINSIRHPKTLELLKPLLEGKNVEEKAIVTFEEFLEASYRIVIAPKELSVRGQELEVKPEDLAILKIKLFNYEGSQGVIWRII